jgi:TolB-like protein/tetratricopeptide (TPR) repeat protein
MDVIKPSTTTESREPAAAERLDSWKEIAAYLKRDESTVRRWEAEGLPVHRQPHKKKATVFAYKSELDAWRRAGQAQLESGAITEPPADRKNRRWIMVAGILVVAVGLALTLGLRGRVFGGLRAGEISSIVVLPLKNLSGDPGQDIFADAITEELITELGKVSALRVLSHQTADAYRQTSKTIPDIAHELNVDAVLEGTVLFAGGRARITANLVSATPERHLWSNSYEGTRQDGLEIHGQIVREVLKQIGVKVTSEEQARLTETRAVDPDARAAYLLGRAYTFKTPWRANAARAREYFLTAIQKAPSYAPSYAGLAELAIHGSAGPQESREDARRWAAAALKLDDGVAGAHNALARAAQQEWDWAGAEREYRRALELEPNNSLAHIWYAMYLSGMQRFDESVEQARRAQQVEPTSPDINGLAASIYLYAGQHENGMRALQTAFDLDPTDSYASTVIARTYVTQKQYPQAIAEIERLFAAAKQREPLLLGALAHAYARNGQPDAALKLVEELKGLDARNRGNSFALVWAYAGLGDKEQFFTWLERAFSEKRDRMVWLNVDPFLEPMRSDPRFADVVRRVGLPTTNQPRSR